ncbi:MAG: hypothetical protein V1918_08205 [Planctomycetota bacterium]
MKPLLALLLILTASFAWGADKLSSDDLLAIMAAKPMETSTLVGASFDGRCVLLKVDRSQDDAYRVYGRYNASASSTAELLILANVSSPPSSARTGETVRLTGTVGWWEQKENKMAIELNDAEVHWWRILGLPHIASAFEKYYQAAQNTETLTSAQLVVLENEFRASLLGQPIRVYCPVENVTSRKDGRYEVVLSFINYTEAARLLDPGTVPYGFQNALPGRGDVPKAPKAPIRGKIKSKPPAPLKSHPPNAAKTPNAMALFLYIYD